MGLGTKILSWLTGGGGEGGGPIGKLIDRIPDKAKREEARREFELAVMTSEDQAAQNLRDFFLEYEGAAKDVHWSLQLYRGSVRPTLTYVLALFMGWMVWKWLNLPQQPPQFFEVFKLVFFLNVISMTFWYGERALKNTGLGKGLSSWMSGTGDGNK
jgi:hypothetical protein